MSGGLGPSSGFWGGAVWGLFIGAFVCAFAGQLTAFAICFGAAVIAAAIREHR